MELRYRFRFASGEEEFKVALEPETLSYRPPASAEPPPDWTRLESNQCPHCPLKPAESPRCPVAANIAPLVDALKDRISYEDAEVSVETPDRVYSKKAPAQFGISGLFGLVMATSGCPILDKLRPMVFTHLPFPNIHESMYRSMSMYLLAQFAAARKGLKPDWSLEGLAKIYDEVSLVNKHISERLRSLALQDASVNAVVNLNCFAWFTSAAIGKSSLGWLDKLFRPYWERA